MSRQTEQARLHAAETVCNLLGQLTEYPAPTPRDPVVLAFVDAAAQYATAAMLDLAAITTTLAPKTPHNAKATPHDPPRNPRRRR